MRCSMQVTLSLLLLAGGARAQSYGVPSLLGQSLGSQSYNARPADPCVAASSGGSALGMLAAALTQSQRDRDCAAERQAQWADYNAKQKAAQDKAAADATAQKQQVDAAARAQAAEQAQRVASAAQQTRRRSAQAARARQDREATAQADRAAAEQARADTRLRSIALIRAENAPGNLCRGPKLARLVMQGWNALDTFKELGVEVIDIEHVSTVYAHPDDESFACHGVFVTNRGWKVAGTATMKRNVAGDPMFVWNRDASQDLSVYDMRPREDAMSPEMARQIKVGAPAPSLTRTVADTQ
jgi:hypothetical protein